MAIKPLLTQIRPTYFSVDCGMAYLIRLENGKFILIDSTFGEYDEVDHIYSLMCEQNETDTLPCVAAWFFTHPHGDHTRGFIGMSKTYADKLTVEKVIYSFPADMCEMTHNHAGFLEASALNGTLDGRFFILDTPMTSREIAREIEKNCGIKHPRIIGAADTKSKKIGMCLGACGNMVFDIIRDTDCEVIIAGEICEWREGCYTRDAAELGFNKSIILLGHCASERDGMKYLTDIWNTMCPEVPGRYFETGELFTYTEDLR